MISEIGWNTEQTNTQANISFAVSAVSQFFQSPCDSHWDAVIHTIIPYGISKENSERYMKIEVRLRQMNILMQTVKITLLTDTMF